MLDRRIIALPVNPPPQGGGGYSPVFTSPTEKGGGTHLCKKPLETNQRFIVGQIMQMNSTKISKWK
jgi:hypothetical protein